MGGASGTFCVRALHLLCPPLICALSSVGHVLGKLSEFLYTPVSTNKILLSTFHTVEEQRSLSVAVSPMSLSMHWISRKTQASHSAGLLHVSQ